MQLAFDLPTYHERVRRAQAHMRAQELDALIVTLPDSIHWLTGFDTIGYLWPQMLLIDGSGGEPVLHTRTTEEPGVRETSWLREPVVYDIARADPVEVLAQSIVQRGLAGASIGIDLHSFTFLPAHWDALKQLLPTARWSDTTDLIAELRLVKSPAELAYQRQAAQMADHAMRVALESLRPGISETEVAGHASRALGEAGSEFPAIPPMVVSGPRSALVHGMATRRTIARGDVVCIEIGAAMHRYHAIVMRSAVVGPASPRTAEVAACLSQALQAAIAAAKPGAAAHEPDDAANAVLSRLDLVRRRCHRIGYSLGLAYPPGWLEPMTLVAGDPHVLQPNISFSLEPNLSLQDEGFGLKLGETLVCTPAGAERMSQLDVGLFIAA
jgi:Xaa-Pro aminopeptidase